MQHLIDLMAGLEIPNPEYWLTRDPKELRFIGSAIAGQAKSANDLQARIDMLMFEYCPEEMTKEQIATFEENQTASDGA